jgi:cytochrome c oxidase assembly factor CtaG
MFLCGCAVLALALLSPIDTLSSDLFTAHMLQHELLVTVAAPLLVAAEPGPTMLWALPQRARYRFGQFLRAPLVRATWRRTTNLPEAWLMHATAIWIWHVPSFFQAALANTAIHNLQHLTFFGTGLLYWWSVLHRGRRSAAGVSVISLFGTAIQTALLGALLALSHAPWYTAYGNRAARWGMTPMEDQQFAGLLMWIPAGFVYLAAALYLFRRWLQPRPAPVGF